MVMADPLCYIKELALKEVNPQLFTMATLTGHVIRAYGTNYTVKNLKKIDNLLIVFAIGST
jgi:leucyl aminopeptidase